MAVVNIAFYLILICSVIHGQWITAKIVHGLVDVKDDYWVIKVNGLVNRPSFPAYIRFYNSRTAKSEFDIDVSKSALVLYHFSPPAIVIRTFNHVWSAGDNYYITIDEGVLYSNNIENSTAYLNPKFWTFQALRPLHS